MGHTSSNCKLSHALPLLNLKHCEQLAGYLDNRASEMRKIIQACILNNTGFSSNVQHEQNVRADHFLGLLYSANVDMVRIRRLYEFRLMAHNTLGATSYNRNHTTPYVQGNLICKLVSSYGRLGKRQRQRENCGPLPQRSSRSARPTPRCSGDSTDNSKFSESLLIVMMNVLLPDLPYVSLLVLDEFSGLKTESRICH